MSRGARFIGAGVYGLAHALVDASCAALLFSAHAAGRLPTSLGLAAILGYNLLAFATQPLLGWHVSDETTGRRWARGGALVTASAFFLGSSAPALGIAIALAGLGNAVFHVGGGVVAMRAEPGKATLPGIFVAPGAAGLAVGIALGSAQRLAWLPALALVLIVPLIRRGASRRDEAATASAVGADGARATQTTVAPDEGPTGVGTHVPAVALGAVVVLMAVIGARAFVGSAVPLPWKADPALLAALTGAVVLGKGAGGMLADRFGRVSVGVGALVLSAPLLVLAPGSVIAGVLGMLLFNMTMPVTLVALYDRMPQRPGFAFGLTCLALIVGTLPALVRAWTPTGPGVTAALVIGSAALLWVGLRRAGHRPTTALDIGIDIKEAS